MYAVRRRAVVSTLALGLLAGLGCTPLAGYLYTPMHFKYATISERELASSVEHTVVNIETILRERNISVRQREVTGDAARLWASKTGVEYVFDVTSSGSGCRVRLEIGQVGNEGQAQDLMATLEMLP